jgi:transcriptional regulator with XRE-family HTH domain
MNADEIGKALKRRRLALGWSLAEVARRAGTSAPTVHRYENGWRRFELSTLEKLAIALGCRLRVSLEPLRRGERRPTARDVHGRIRRLFWDRPLQPEDLRRYPSWVITRVLEYGKLDDVRMLIGYLGKDRFLDLLQEIHLPSDGDRIFWEAMLKQEGRTCTREFSRKAAERSWTA